MPLVEGVDDLALLPVAQGHVACLPQHHIVAAVVAQHHLVHIVLAHVLGHRVKEHPKAVGTQTTNRVPACRGTGGVG